MPTSIQSQENTSTGNIDQVRDRYFTPHEVASHNVRGDIWLSWLGRVYDLSPLIEEYFGDPKLLPIIQNAGKDISHWFDPKSGGDLRLCTDIRTGLRVPVCPQGTPVHVANGTEPCTTIPEQPCVPWWLDTKKYSIGQLSSQTRHVKIVNTLVGTETILEVCSEEPIRAIEQRYIKYNSHAKGYVWKYMNQVLDMAATLDQNGIPNESTEMEQLGMNELDWMPAFLLYFADDLTEA